MFAASAPSKKPVSLLYVCFDVGRPRGIIAARVAACVRQYPIRPKSKPRGTLNRQEDAHPSTSASRAGDSTRWGGVDVSQDSAQPPQGRNITSSGGAIRKLVPTWFQLTRNPVHAAAPRPPHQPLESRTFTSSCIAVAGPGSDS